MPPLPRMTSLGHCPGWQPCPIIEEVPKALSTLNGKRVLLVAAAATTASLILVGAALAENYQYRFTKADEAVAARIVQHAVAKGWTGGAVKPDLTPDPLRCPGFYAPRESDLVITGAQGDGLHLQHGPGTRHLRGRLPVGRNDGKRLAAQLRQGGVLPMPPRQGALAPRAGIEDRLAGAAHAATPGHALVCLSPRASRTRVRRS